MKINKRVLGAATGLTVAALAGTFVFGVTAANAAAPAWEPDTNAAGTITFYDSTGNVITSGSTTASPFVAYAVGTSDPSVSGHTGVPRTGDTQAQIQFANPDPTNGLTATWFNLSPGNFNHYPLTTGPSNIQTASQSEPVAAPASGDAALSDFIGVAAPNTASGYANVYQIRLQTANSSNQVAPKYDTADVLVNPANNTWTQIYPAVATPTTTTLGSSANPSIQGASVTLTATESPATAGSVQFQDGAANLGSPVPVNGSGVATLNTSFSTTGPHSLHAVFSPTDTTNFSGSTGNLTQAVNPPATPTNTALTATHGQYSNQDVNLVATVTPTSAAGTVAFFDNGSTTAIPGTVTPGAGNTFTLDLPTGMASGNHSIVAKFTPTDVTQFQASQSSPQAFVLQTQPVGACAQPGSQCSDTQNIQVTVPVGTLIISTPYTVGSPLDLGTMSIDTTAGLFSATGAFNNIQISDTRAGNLPYTVTANSSNLSDGGAAAGSTIDAHNVGLTGLATTSTGSGFAGVVTYTNHAAANPPVLPGGGGTAGLAGGQTIIGVDHGAGVLTAHGTLTITAPLSTEPGLFTGTITFTVG